MADERLTIIIQAKDQASKILGGVGGSLKGIATAGLAGTAALVGGLGLVGAKLIDLGSDAEEMRGKFDVVFGPESEAWANRFDILSDKLNRNKYELMEYGAALQDTFVPLGFARNEAANFAIELTQLTVDLASFNNAAEPDVLRDLQSALVGNHETVRKYGVILTEAVLKQELARMGMADLEGAALEQAKVQARMNLILAGTADAQGDAERTAGSWANQMRAVKASLSETATTMGAELLPIVTPFLMNFAALAEQYAPMVIARFSEFASEMSETTGPALLLINDALTRISTALGLTSENVTAGDAVLAIFGATLDSIVIGIQAFAVGMQGAAWAVEQVSEAIKIAIGLYEQLSAIMSAGQTIGAGGNAFNAASMGGQAPSGFPGVPNVNNNIQLNPTPVTINLDGKTIAKNTSSYQGGGYRDYLAMGGIGAQ